MSKVVLDASAFLAFLGAEVGADTVQQAIRTGAFISAVNLAEVLSKVSEVGRDPEQLYAELMEHRVLGYGIVVRPFREEDAVAISKLRVRTKKFGLSLGDRTCLALGAALQLPILTADKSWLRLDLGLAIELIR
jgi:ribonuclease VapC